MKCHPCLTAEGEIDGELYPAPHCDPYVLHAPTANCKYCNAFPERQAERVAANVNFTGEGDESKAQCPAEARRRVGVIHRWAGNVPMTPEAEATLDAYWANVRAQLNLARKP